MGRPMGELTATTAIIPAGNRSAAVTAVASKAPPELGSIGGALTTDQNTAGRAGINPPMRLGSE